MSEPNRPLWLQLTAGQGPLECAWAVVEVLQHLQHDAAQAGLRLRTIELEPGPGRGTAHSALLELSGPAGLHAFAESWRGTIQWTARSPYRPHHKRRNWFVGIEILEPVELTRFHPADVAWETMRAAGPGGQHVNRTESAVRVTHKPTGLQATAMEERSQHSNRRLALARLVRKLEQANADREGQARAGRWRSHHGLERGNPSRILRGPA